MTPTVQVTDYGFKSLDTERSIVEGAGFRFNAAQCRTPEEVIATSQEADVLLVQWAPVTADAIKALPRCRAIVRYGIGVDNVDLAAARAKGVAVCNVPDYCIDEVADHTLALALALARQLPTTHARVMSGEWKIVPPASLPAFRNMMFACAGFGRIARGVLTRASVFGFKTAAYDPYVTDDILGLYGVQRITLDELFRKSDILSLHLPLSSATKHFVNSTTLTQMKPGAVLINTSRGSLVDTVALSEALKSGRLNGAGLDVFEQEPLPLDHPLRGTHTALLTSHTAWFSESSVPRLQRLAAEEAVRAMKGEPLRNQVNR